MSHEVRDGVWATNDGSYGSGEIVVVDPSTWGRKQRRWFDRLSDIGEVYAEDLINIDEGIKPRGLE